MSTRANAALGADHWAFALFLPGAEQTLHASLHPADASERQMLFEALGELDREGLMYENGQGVARDDADATKWTRLAAAQGHAVAQNNLGLMYAKGWGVARDDAEAVKWYRLAAAQGYAKAQFNFGAAYHNGTGVPQNRIAAYALRKLSAAADSLDDHKTAVDLGLVLERMSPAEIKAAQALSREMAKPGNLLRALDDYLMPRMRRPASGRGR